MRSRPHPSQLLLPLLFCTGSILCSGSAALGDVVTLLDGRKYEGKILEQSAAGVMIDTMVGTTRVKFRLRAYEVQDIKKGALPADFFEPKIKVDERVSDPDKFKADTTLYLEVPIVGRFGLQVVPSGLGKALAYAVKHKIPHVVFFIDSQGGDQVAASEIYDLLKEYDGKLKYHGIVRDAVGVAMAVAVWCETLFLLPGSNLGGVELIYEKEKYEGDPTVLRSQVAYEVDEVAQKKGWPAGIMRAMIDPAVQVSAWRDESGQVKTGVRVPDTVSEQKVIFTCRGDSVLTLNRTEAETLGARKYNGDATGLGVELELTNWTAESDYGKKAMMTAARARQRVADRNAEKVKKIVVRRTQVQEYIDHNLTIASEFDPSLEKNTPYSSFKDSWDRFWGGGALVGTTTATRWRELTDKTLMGLRNARKGLMEMKKLNVEGEKLGMEPSPDPGELDKSIRDLDMKIRFVSWWRTRKTSAAG